MIANQVRDRKDADELFDKISGVVNKFLNIDIQYMGAVPYDSNMQKAIMRQQPVSMSSPNSMAAKSLEQIVRKLEHMEQEDVRVFGIMQMFSNVIRMKFNRD